MLSDLYKKHKLFFGCKDKISPEEFNIIASFVIKKPKEFVLSHPDLKISFLEKIKLFYFLKQRTKGKPIAYILKEKEFFGLNFFVNKHTLVSRPETEFLVEKILTHLNTEASPLHNKTLFLDIGTGSGCIVISLAKTLRGSVVQNNNNIVFRASDISKKALKVANKNIKKHSLEKIIKTFKSNLLLNKKLTENLQNFNNLIICANLPYVPSKYLSKAKNKNTIGLKYEPKTALDGGKDGLDFYRKLIKQTKEIKKEHPKLKITSFYEIEKGQKEILDNILKNTKEKSCTKDNARIDRVYSFIL